MRRKQPLFISIWICLSCQASNSVGAELCLSCGKARRQRELLGLRH